MVNGLIEVSYFTKQAYHFVVKKLWRFILWKAFKSVGTLKCILAKAHFAIGSNPEKISLANTIFSASIVTFIKGIATPLFDFSSYGYYRPCSITTPDNYEIIISTRNSSCFITITIDDDSPFSSLNRKSNKVIRIIAIPFGSIPFRNKSCRNACIIR